MMNRVIKSLSRYVLRYVLISLFIIPLLFLSSCSLGKEEPPETEPTPPVKVEEQEETPVKSEPEVIKKKKTETAIQREPEIEVGEIEESVTPFKKGVFQTGQASWYGPDFHGKRTANGERYDMNKLTAAHKKLPFHTLVEVENIDNRKKVVVRINDRGPFIKGRIIDLSKKAARQIGMLKPGTAPVHLRIIKAGDIKRLPTRSTSPKNTGVSVTPTTKPAPKPLRKVTSSGNIFLQAGSFSLRENAKRMVQHLKDVLPELTFNIRYMEGAYKVLSIRFPSRAKAEEWKKRLLEYGFDSFIKKQ